MTPVDRNGGTSAGFKHVIALQRAVSMHRAPVLHHGLAPGPSIAVRLALTFVVGVLLMMPTAQSQDGPDWQAVEAVPLVEDVQMPVDIDIAPDGAVWFIELPGTVKRYDPAADEVTIMHHVDNVITGGERGLVGFALAHDFESTGAYYLYYTEDVGDPDGGMNRLVRVVDREATVLASVPGAPEHNGGRIVVGPDGNLFVGTGENQLRDPAQDPASHLGKILHLTPDGRPVEGNIAGLVYSLGHRNVYGLALDPETNELWGTENSGWRRDEVNRVEAGGNYGYPECEGHGLNGVDDPCPTDKGYVFPVKTYYEDRAAAPTGATFFRGDFHWGSLNEGSIHRLHQLDNGTWDDTIVFQQEGPILDLAVGPQGHFYFSGFSGIYLLEFPGDTYEFIVGEDEGPDTSANQDAPGPGIVLVCIAAVAAIGWHVRRP